MSRQRRDRTPRGRGSCAPRASCSRSAATRRSGPRRSCAAARVTRGALYHHFADKRDLFRAVHEQLEGELTDAIAAELAGAGTDDPVEALTTATRTFLDACTEPEIARITLLEAPAVLGWEEWRRIDEQYGLGLTIAG